MADKKISEMVAMTSSEIANDDNIVISDTSASHTKRTPISELSNFFGINPEGQRDTVGAMFNAGTHTGVTVTYDDPNDSINIAINGSVTDTELGYLHGTTSDIQTQFGTKSPIASPTFTGTASAPTPSANDNSTKIATTSYVQGELSAYNTDTLTLTGKSGAISMWTNDSGYITPSSSSALTNKTGSNSQWTNDESYIKAGTTDTLQNKTISGSNNTLSNIPYTAVSGIVDTDITSVSSSDDELASSKAIKTYVDAQITGIDALSEAVDSNISSPSAGQVLVYDGTDSWDNQTTSVALTGQVTGTADMNSSGDVSVATTIANPTMTINGVSCTLGSSATIPSVLSGGGSFSGEVHANDNVKFTFGGALGSADMEIYHDTTNSHIGNATGELRVRGDTVNIKNNADNSTLATFNNGGASELYHNGTKKIETTSAGATVSGTLTATTLSGAISGNISQLTNDSAYLTTITSAQVVSALGFTPISTDTTIGGSSGADFNDNVKLRFGDASSPDMEIYHDGSHSRIADVGTGNLKLQGNDLALTNSDDSKTYIGCVNGGEVNLYHNNALRFSTDANGCKMGDGIELRMGDSDDAKIYFDGTNTDIVHTSGSGSLQIEGDSVVINKGDGSETMAQFNANGSVKLYYDNTNMASTVSDGFRVEADKRLEIANGGNWSGELAGKIEHHSSSMYHQYLTSFITRNASGTNTLDIDNAGNGVFTGNVTAYSDSRLKEDVKTIDNALDKVSKLRGVEYTRKETQEREIGVIAQEVKEIVPELVSIKAEQDSVNKDGLKDVHIMKYQNTVGLLIEAIKDLKAEIEELKKDK